MAGIGDDFSIFRVNPTPNVLDDDEKGRRQRGQQDADAQGYKESKDQARRKMAASAALLRVKKMMKKVVETKDEEVSEKLKKHETYELNESEASEKAQSILKKS